VFHERLNWPVTVISLGAISHLEQGHALIFRRSSGSPIRSKF